MRNLLSPPRSGRTSASRNSWKHSRNTAGATGASALFKARFHRFNGFQKAFLSCDFCDVFGPDWSEYKTEQPKKGHMKITQFIGILTVSTITSLIPLSHAADLNSLPPVVVKTVPEAGAQNVAPGEVEIRVTFSKKMKDGSWSW